MKSIAHKVNNTEILEFVSDGIIISSLQDALDLIGEAFFQGYGKLMLHEKNIVADFFDLKTGLAGDILQKFSTYNIQLAIIGDFEKFSSRSLRAFMIESNKMDRIGFVGSLPEAIQRLTN